MKNYALHREIPVDGDYDVAVAGGGPAGSAAALCAARNCGTRDLPYGTLRDALNKAGVYFES